MEKKISEISARVTEMIDILQETPNSFAKKLGYTRAQTLYDIINGKSAPSYDFFYKFALSEFSVIINITWLLTGIGDIKQKKIEQKNVEQYKYDFSQLLNTIKEQAEEIGQLRERLNNAHDKKDFKNKHLT